MEHYQALCFKTWITNNLQTLKINVHAFLVCLEIRIFYIFFLTQNEHHFILKKKSLLEVAVIL